MKNILYAGISALAMGLLVNACSSDNSENEVTIPTGAVTFRADLTPASRATETSFEEGDEIAVLYNKDGNNMAYNFANPNHYVYRNARIVPMSEEDAFIKKPEEEVAYIAYYPYISDLFITQRFAVKSDQSAHTDYTASDFCAAWSGFSADPEVNLTFFHCLSHIVVNISGYYLAGDMQARLNGVASETTMEISSRRFIPTGTTADIQMCPNGTLSYKAIVSPQVISAGHDFLTISVNGREFPLHSTVDMELKSGREYVFNVKVVNGEPVGFDAELRPWNATESSDAFGEQYFSIENALFVDDDCEGGTADPDDTSVSMNESALAGGLNFITVRTPVNFRAILVAASGHRGYWECHPEKVDDAYQIPVLYGLGFDSDVKMTVVGVMNNGDKTVPYDCDVRHVDSKIGDLNINLTFSTPKDVDLHLYTPSGLHIYYGNRGGTTEIDGVTYEYGLDHDSNAGCTIDNLNNENIFLPAAMIEPGEYIVQVDMYKNCDYSYDCQWAVSARYNGNLVNNEMTEYGNPASGNYPADCGNGDHTNVMRFTLIPAGTDYAPRALPLKVTTTPRKVSEVEQLKIEGYFDDFED